VDVDVDVWLFCSYDVDMPGTSKKAKPKSPKDGVVRMRISTDHKRALEQAAARDGLELSAWLRQLALRAAGVLPSAKHGG